MNRISDTITPVVQAYSLSEYNVQQRAQEDQKKADVQNKLNEARESLRGGNLRQAITSLNRSKSKGLQNNQAGEQGNVLNDVERNLRQAQSSNLIQAQNGFLLDNAGRLGDQTLQWQNQQLASTEAPQQRPGAQTGQSPNLFLNYDAEVAGQQWDKMAFVPQRNPQYPKS